MYCKACGKELGSEATICMGCGVPVGKGNSFCQVCGEQVNPNAVICVRCGATLEEPKPEIPEGAKSRVVAGLLGIFLGMFGVHNFYLKRHGRAILQLVLGGGGVLLYFVVVADLILAALMRTVEDGATVLGAFLLLVASFGMIVSVIWSFVEAILLLCGATKVDGQGKPFRD